MAFISITRGEEGEHYSHVATWSSSHEVFQLLGTSQSTSYRICREHVPHVEPSRGERPKNIILAQQQACVRAITIGGLYCVIDVRYALSEHLNVVESTNALRRAFHEACLRFSLSYVKCKTLAFIMKSLEYYFHPLDVTLKNLSLQYMSWKLIHLFLQKVNKSIRNLSSNDQ